MCKVRSKYFVSLLLLLALTVILVACSAESDSDESASNQDGGNTNETTKSDDTPKEGGEAVIAAAADITSFDPIKSTGSGDYAFLWPVYDTLIIYNDSLEPEPGLAESWDFQDDNTMVLHLRENVKFHDGTMFDAEAVKFNIERANNSEDSTITELKNIESVEVVDSSTVKLHLKEPDASILLALTERAGIMASPTAVQENGEDFSQSPVGAGPFKMVKRIPNGEVLYEKFDDYWQEGKPYLNKMEIKIMTDETTRINALKSGEIDLMEGVSPFSVASLEGIQNIYIANVPSFKFKHISFNSNKPPFDSLAFRQAVTHAIDRELLAEALLHGHGEPSYQIFPNDYWAANSDLKIEYNPERSKELLKESGIENPTFSMITSVSDPYEPMLSEAVKDQLGKVGIEVKLESMEQSAAISRFWGEKTGDSFIASGAGKPDPHSLIEIWLAKESFYNPGGQSTPEFESLISKANAIQNQAERAKLYSELNRIQAEEVINVIPIVSIPVIYAMDKQVKGFEPNGFGKSAFSNIWMEQ